MSQTKGVAHFGRRSAAAPRCTFPPPFTRALNPSGYLERVFAVVPNVLMSSPPDAAGAMLHTLFNRAKNTPAIFGWLHSYMVSHWPLPDAKFAPYDPSQIFDESYTVLSASPGAHLASSVLHSLRDMVERSVVPETKVTQVAAAACVVWPIDPEHTAELIKSLGGVLLPGQIANLLDSVELADERKCELLLGVWKSLSSEISEGNRGEVTLLILRKSTRGIEGQPDLGLTLWLDAKPEAKNSQLKDAIASTALNDDQRMRVWAQVESSVENRGLQFFKDVLPVVLSLSDAESTVSSVLRSASGINALFPTRADKFDLSDLLLRALPKAATNTAKVGITDWLNELGEHAVLRRVNSVEGMTQEDLELLVQRFPRIRTVKQALAARLADAAG